MSSPHPAHIKGKDDMNTYTSQHLSNIRHHDLIARADHIRQVNEARQASRASSTPSRRPLIWLREAAGSFAARLMTRAGSHVASQ